MFAEIASAVRKGSAVSVLLLCILWKIPGAESEGRPKIAVVLSGGSAYGMAHVGVLKVLEEAGIPIDLVVGTSMGSIVGGLYAAGYSPDGMEALVGSVDWASVFQDRRADPADRYERSIRSDYILRLGIGPKGLAVGEGLLEGQSILSLFTEWTLHMLPTRNFDDFPVPYRAVATDISSGEKVVFSSGSLAEAMRSSMSIPAVFKPYSAGGRQLVDGGMVENLPVQTARQAGADIVIAVVARHPELAKGTELESALQIAGQSVNIFLMQNMKPSMDQADLLITPDLGGFGSASYSEARELVERGRTEAERAGDSIRAFARELSNRRPLVKPEDQANRRALRDVPIPARVVVRGGSEADQARVRALCAPLLAGAAEKSDAPGSPGAGAAAPAREDFRGVVDTLYQTGAYSLVKYDLVPGPEGPVLEIVLVPEKPAGSAVYLGLDFQGTYTSVISSRMILSSALLLRDATGPGSALLAQAALVNRTQAGLEYFQPLGKLFAKAWARYGFEYDVLGDEAVPLIVGSKYRSLGAGLWAGAVLTRSADAQIGFAWEEVSTLVGWEYGPQYRPSVRAALRVDTMDATAFAGSGVRATLFGRYLDRRFGAGETSLQGDLDAQAVVPLGRGRYLQASILAGTDWSFAGLDSVAPPWYLSLKKPNMFYGFHDHSSMVRGNHILGAALEYRQALGRLSPVLGGDTFLLVNGSLGVAKQQWETVGGSDFFPLRWSATAGAGIRLNRSFSGMAGLSLVGNGDPGLPLGGAFTLQIGSFLDRVEARR